MRILHVGKFFPPQRGGMEAYLADLVAQQRAEGHEACVLVHGDPLPDDPAWLRRVPVQGALSYAPVALGFGFALQRALRDFAPDVLHLHLPNSAALWALGALRARSLPWVVHWHSDVLVPDPGFFLRLALRTYAWFERALLARADRVIATSPDYLLASEPLAPWRHKCAVVPLGLPASPPPMAAAPAAWTPGKLRLLSIGRLSHYKGFDTLIRAAGGLPEVELQIAGGGECAEELAALLRAENITNVRLLGEIGDAEKHGLLASCDLFCLASNARTEAFGLVLLEAMQHARPCIVSDLAGSGMPWVVRSSGAGWLAPVGDAAGWRAAIQAAAASPSDRAARGRAGQAAQRERFSIAASSQSLAGHYRTLTGSLPAPVRPQDVLVVIPARDEITTIGTIVRELVAAGWVHVLVVDDHSVDGTGDAAAAAGARVLRGALPMGAWGAMQTGLRYAAAHGFGGVLTMDADGQHETQDIPALLAASAGADVVIGAFPERASRLRLLAWRWFRELAGFDLRDLTSGFRFYTGPAVAILAAEEATLLDYQDIGILLMLRRAGLTIREVPVTMAARTSGKSRIFSSWFKVGRYMALTTLLCLARWDVRRVRAAG